MERKVKAQSNVKIIGMKTNKAEQQEYWENSVTFEGKSEILRSVIGPNLLREILLAIEQHQSHPLGLFGEITLSRNKDTLYMDVVVNHEEMLYRICVKYHPEKRKNDFLHASPYKKDNKKDNALIRHQGVLHRWLASNPSTEEYFKK